MSNSQKKFEEASEKLLLTLQNLEKITIEKLDKISFNTNDDSVSDLQNKLLQQDEIIKNLSQELNNMQNNMREIGKENDFLKDKNNFFSDKIFKFKSQAPKFIQSIEDDMNRILTIIKNEQL